MPEQYSPDVQKQLSDAEASLDNALSQMKVQDDEPQKEESHEPEVERPKPEREEQAEVTKKKGADFVDIKDPEIKDRVNYLYLQAKSADEKNKLLLEQNKKLQEKLEGLSKDVSTIQNETRQKREDSEIKNIKAQLKEAWAVGDFDRAADLNDNLVQLAAEQQRRLLMEVSKAEETKPKEPTIPEMDQRSRQDAQFIDFLSKEKDNQGNLIRPYLNEWHPDNNRAANEAAKIATEFAQAGRQTTIAEVMRELDRRMKPANQSSADNVLSSNRGEQPQKKNVDLSAEERVMARKMGISEKDWATQKELLRRERRG